MTCLTHPDRDKVVDCSVCDRALCSECLYYANSAPYCHSCVTMVEREFLAMQKRRRKRTILAIPTGVAVGIVAVLGWRWFMFETGFGMMMFTPMVMVGVILGVAVMMCQIAGARSLKLFTAGAILAVAIMLGEEHIEYDYAIYNTAQQSGLTAEKLLRVVEDYTYVDHLKTRGIYSYFFFAVGIFLTWRRLWPMSNDELILIRPDDIKT
jgi:hypothetical protein